ncbi:MAG: DUF58 domain-containing protein [Flavobacteriaceae bacterium]|jgi:uncharacterized protein (DUF58 family)|nr:DUF58 domain-containing protein [Flavobacteriaceae bacterium]
MIQFFKQLYLKQRVFYGFGILVILFGCSYVFPLLYRVAWGALGLFTALIIVDILLLFAKSSHLHADRILPEKLSNGDNNPIGIDLKNKAAFALHCEIIDEIPFQFQKRDFNIQLHLKAKEQRSITYSLSPKERGVYQFGKLNIYVSSPLQLISKRYMYAEAANTACYPSFIQMKKYDLIAFSKNKFAYGLKKIRKIGNTTEFEQIKEYVIGDDIRTINWKATAKKQELMVNQFQDENTQSIYCLIDKGRAMQMPFDGLSLLDYAINATLALSNVILKKNDRVGMMTFSNTIDNKLPAENKKTQLHKIMEQLYHVKTNFFESDYSRLYAQVKHHITHRSLLILFTNFEAMANLERQLPYLRALAKNHLLVVVFFENTELSKLASKSAKNVDDIFDKVIAEKFTFEKRLIVNELTKYGIQSVLTKPEDLSIQTINKYLQIKAKGIL